jgi:hypothetical protein
MAAKTRQAPNALPGGKKGGFAGKAGGTAPVANEWLQRARRRGRR